MTSSFRPIPWFFVTLDIIGALFLVLGILALAGIDFGHPVLREAAAGFLLIGIGFMVPLLIWVIRRLRKV
jgi:hypothetical protein